MTLRCGAVFVVLLLSPAVWGSGAPKRVAAPSYPQVAHRARVQGTVKVRCQLGSDGTVYAVTVVSKKSALDEAAVDAARLWIFPEPSADDVSVELTFEFRLEGDCREYSLSSCEQTSWIDTDRLKAVTKTGNPKSDH